MRTLKLDRNYRPIAFISVRDTAKHIAKGKVEILSTWVGVPFFHDTELPAIVRLKDTPGRKGYVRKKPLLPRFNFKGVFRRDLYTCQYTGEVLPSSKLTVDHVIPKSRGGKSTWQNCVTASLEVNAAKANRTPEEAGLKLLNVPCPPPDPLGLEYATMYQVHEDWAMYFPNVERKARSKIDSDKIAS